MDQRMAIEHGPDLGAPEWQAEVAGGTLVDGVDGEATGLIGGLGENVGLEFHGKERGRVKGECSFTPPAEGVQSPIFGIKKASRSGSL